VVRPLPLQILNLTVLSSHSLHHTTHPSIILIKTRHLISTSQHYQDIELTKANQPGARERAGPLAMDTGGMYGGGGDSTGVGDGSPSVGTAGSSNNADALAAVSAKTGTSLGGEAPLWDPHTGEHLRTTTQLPTNGPWVFQDAFTQSQPFVNGSLRFLHRMNTYVVIRAQTDTDVVLQTSDDKGFWSGSQGP